ncbi:MAG: TlpA family protein disulfide reductase [Sphingobacterium sp.]|jgi:peroxiredoxin|nr:TlpA family protein disulfide reductase [Sphingobacterium sp.]
MNKIITPLIQLLFLLIVQIGYSQDNFTARISIEIPGVSNVKLSFVLGTAYYENSLNSFKEEKHQQSIIISGRIENPYLCELVINDSHYSKPFMIYEGNNNLRVVEVNGSYIVLREDSQNDYLMFNYLSSSYPKSGDIYAYLAKKELGNIAERDSLLRDSYAQTDTILYNYTKLYPKSYYGLWFIANLIRFGYNDIHGEAFSNLSIDLKDSFLGKIVKTEIDGYSKTSVGKHIPDISFQDSTSKDVNLLKLVDKKEFTLLSFWYHNCGPCISKFPDLKSIHEKYSDSFQVIGISTDDRSNKDQWLLTLSKHKLPWVNLIDLEQQSYNNFKIQVFPFSYLVNRRGEIIKINPSIVELNKFLNHK